MKLQAKNYFKNFIAFFVSLFLLVFLFYKIDVKKIIEVLSKSNLTLIFLAIAISLSINIFFGAYKWRKILCVLDYRLSYWEALIIRSGFLPFKIISPLKSSELIKAFWLNKKKDIEFGKALSSLLFDRILNLLVTIGIFLIALVLTRLQISYFFIFFLFFGMVSFLLFNRLRDAILNIVKKIHLKLYEFVEQLFSSFNETSLKEKILLLFYSIIYQFSEFLNTYILFLAVGVRIPILAILLYTPIVMIVNQLPISILGLGTREALLVFLFSKFGPISSLLGGGLLISLIEHILPVVFGLFFIRKLI
ncbi:MAG: flippase-like domain-containing protein [Candidatus Omnitrophica bacterium]|nr:flippase-like domain-containing protein [Candidatus Omnitrophota bacterium]